MRFTLGPIAPGPSGHSFPPQPTSPAAATSQHYSPRSSSSIFDSPILVTLAVLAVMGTVCGVGFYLLSQYSSVSARRPGATLESAEYNFAYEFPAPPWQKDTSPPLAARANLFALRRGEGESHAAFAASQFNTHNPQPGELREPLVDRLRQLFDEPELTPQNGAMWAGQPAVAYTFRGIERDTRTTCIGEAYAIGYQGIGYWCLTWGPEREAGILIDEFAELRANFRLLDHRRDWKPTASPFEVYPGHALDYKIIDTERWWKKPPRLEPEDVDPRADLVLWAEYQFKQRVDVKPKAELIVYILEPSDGDPVDAVRRLIRERYDKESDLFGETKVTELRDEPQGDPPAHTEQQGIETIRLRADSQRDPKRSRLHVLAAIVVDGKVVGVEAHCPLADRHLWERRLIHIAGSLRPGR